MHLSFALAEENTERWRFAFSAHTKWPLFEVQGFSSGLSFCVKLLQDALWGESEGMVGQQTPGQRDGKSYAKQVFFIPFV